MDENASAIRYVNLLGATGQVRVAKFREREHIVVPVVALIEGVLFPANAPAPEYVPADVIGAAPQSWNGRPVVCGHPRRGEEFVSANDPEVLEAEGIGMLFNSAFEKNKLTMEAWIDKERADLPDSKGANLLRRLENGEQIEVSVGAIVRADRVAGQFNGKQYSAIWRQMMPDHLAMLDAGDRGACSCDAGCGAPRMAMRHLVTAEGLVLEEESMPDPQAPVVEETPKRSLRERLLDLMKFRSNSSEEDMSDRDLRSMLERALASEPGFLGIDSVFPNDNSVIYAVASQTSVTLFRRSYTLNNGEVKFASKKEEVQPVTRFEPVNAQCGCAEPGGTMDKAQRVKALIDSGRFLETDRPWLEQIPEDRLSALEAQPTPPAAPAAGSTSTTQVAASAAPQAPAPVAQGASPQTVEQYINAAPPELQESLREGLRVSQARRQEVVTALKATGRCDFTDEQLAAKPTCELERLLKLADVPPPVIYQGRLNHRSMEQPQGVPAAPSIAEALAARK